METPIYTKLREYYSKNRIPFAMPGHKNARGLVTDLRGCDVTELDATVDLHAESAELCRANGLLAELYGADRSFILTGGSTSCIQVMLSSVLRPGDTLLASADCHMSVINTCAVCGFNIRLVAADSCELELTTDIKAVLLTSPSYYGITKEVCAVAEKCHAAGIPLLVDEAHGAHFIGNGCFPTSAVGIADMVCHSAHKTLNALTGAAYLHISGGRIDIKRVKRGIDAFLTSSPSYPIAVSADIARAALAEADYDRIISKCHALRETAESELGLGVLENHDITRIVLDFSGYGISGYEAADRLSRVYGIDVEMADLYNIVLIATPWNKESDFERLLSALRAMTDGAEKCGAAVRIIPPPVPDEVISPAAGWYAQTEAISIDEAQGRVAAAVVSAYPPGTAILVTGGIIRKESIEYIKMLNAAGAKLTGIRDNEIEVIR